MGISIYDFDTRFPIMLAAPWGWWADAMLSAYSAWCEAAINTMVYPFQWPPRQGVAADRRPQARGYTRR